MLALQGEADGRVLRFEDGGWLAVRALCHGQFWSARSELTFLLNNIFEHALELGVVRLLFEVQAVNLFHEVYEQPGSRSLAEPFGSGIKFYRLDKVKLLFDRHGQFGHEGQKTLNHVDQQVRQRYQIVSPTLLLEQHRIDARHHQVRCELFLCTALNVLAFFCEVIEAPIHVYQHNPWRRCLLSRPCRRHLALLLNKNVFEAEVVVDLACGVQLFEAVDEAGAHLAHCVQRELVLAIRNEVEEGVACLLHHDERMSDAFAIGLLCGLSELALPQPGPDELWVVFDGELATPEEMKEAVARFLSFLVLIQHFLQVEFVYAAL